MFIVTLHYSSWNPSKLWPFQGFLPLVAEHFLGSAACTLPRFVLECGHQRRRCIAADGFWPGTPWRPWMSSVDFEYLDWDHFQGLCGYVFVIVGDAKSLNSDADLKRGRIEFSALKFHVSPIGLKILPFQFLFWSILRLTQIISTKQPHLFMGQIKEIQPTKVIRCEQ